MTIKQIDNKLLDDLTAKAVTSPRKRAHHNLHDALEDPVQRLCVSIEPGTYIRPHRHADLRLRASFWHNTAGPGHGLVPARACAGP